MARLSARRPAGPALRLPRPRPVRAARRAIASTRTRCSSIRTPASWRGRPGGTTRCSATDRHAGRRVVRRSRQRRRTRRSPPSSTAPSRGATTARCARPWHETVIYELHVKGFTQRHPDVAGGAARHLSRPRVGAAIEHLLTLGVTAVELLPVHHHIDDWHLVQARADATTGATTRSPTSPPTRATRVGRRRSSACASSRRWCARCTRPASR